jgi:hypothetical protein
MTSEKYFAGGIVLMEIDCDRANPAFDQFTITVRDERGRTIRRERYTRADVEESTRMMSGPRLLERVKSPSTEPSSQPATQSATTELETPEDRKFRVESERRKLAAAAATQPARLLSH